jgi:hypothetical protein
MTGSILVSSIDQTTIKVYDSSPAPYVNFVNTFGDTARSLLATAGLGPGSPRQFPVSDLGGVSAGVG